jgi:hypothetical protein
MRTVRALLVAGATIIALSVLAPSVSADSPHHRTFHLDKTCESDVLCTIVSSTFKPFRPGTDVTYVNSDPWNGLAYPTIKIRHGSTTGVCDWNQPPGPVLAKCTFSKGTGRLTGFHLKVDVTVTGDPSLPTSVWHWDGTYWFNHHHHHHHDNH